MQIKVVIGADHRGYHLKEILKSDLGYHIANLTIQDIGSFDSERSDYPEFAIKVAEHIKSGHAQYGILLCASGIGMAIAANRYKNIYAGICWNEKVARQAKEDDNINVLVLPSDYVSPEEAGKIIKAWLESKFKGDSNGKRYRDRISMIDNIKS